MSMLIDLLPSTIEIEGVEYDISSNFRDSILFEILMQDSKIPDQDKLILGLQYYFRDKIPKNINIAVEKMLWFYKCGKEEVEAKGTGSGENVGQIYSYEHDDDYIYSAFLDQYGIDLQDIEYLHWWKFKAMFKSLKEDNKISKIMGYRSMKIDSDMSDNEKKFYKEMKQIYSLPDLRTEEEKEIDFHDTFSSML